MSEPTLESIPPADRVRRLVKHYDPTKEKATENTLAKFAGKEKALLTTLIKKYGEEQPLTTEEKTKYAAKATPPSAAASSKSTPSVAASSTPPPPSQQQAAATAGSIKALDDLSYPERIRRLVKERDPTKEKATENTLAKFVGKEKALLATLVKKYGEESPLTEEEKKPNVTTSNPETSSPPPPSTNTTAPSSPQEDETKKKKPEKEITLEDMPWEDRILRYVQKNEPEKVNTVGQSLIEYKGKESALLQSLKSKHGDEPPITEEEKEKIRNPPPKTDEEKAKEADAGASNNEEEEKKKKEQEAAAAEEEEKKKKEAEEQEEANKKPKEPNPHQDAFDLIARPPSPKPVSIQERIKRMAIHYDPKNLNAVETALQRNKGKEQDLLNALIQQYGPEPDYSRSIVSTDPDALNLAPELDNPPKSFGETYARILRLVEVKDPDQLYNLPITLEAYRGKEETLLRALIAKYGEEPPQSTDYSILENEELAARLALGGGYFGGGTSGSRTSLSQSGTTGGLLSRGGNVSDVLLSQKYKMNPPPPPPNYSGFARMTEGRLTQETTRDLVAAASPSPSPASANNNTFTPPPPNVPEQIFQLPTKDDELEKITAAKFHGWGRAVDKPVCEKLYYAPNVFKNVKSVPTAPTPKSSSSVSFQTSSGVAAAAQDQESEEDRKKRLIEQRKSRPPPPRALLLSSDQRIFNAETPIAKMSDVDHDLITNEVISRVSKDIDKLTKEEEPTIRKEMMDEYDEYVEKMQKKLDKEKERALKRLTERMSGHINTIHERFAFKPNTLTYSPTEKDGSPNNMYYDDDERLKRKSAGFEEDLFGSPSSSHSPINDGDLGLLSDRETFLLSVLPDERSKLKWKYNTGIDNRSPPSWQFRARLGRFVRKYIPSALDDVDTVAQDHVGREENLFAFLRAKYGPEPGAIDSEFFAKAHEGAFPTTAEVANAALDQPPVARSLEELEDFVFAPGDGPPGRSRNNYQSSPSTRNIDPNFTYSGIPPQQPPSLEDELQELRQTAYLQNGNNNNAWDPQTTQQFYQIMQNAENRKKLGLNDGRQLSEEEEKNMDPRLKEVRSLMQAIEASSNALVMEDPRWMSEENLPKHFWDIVEHREFDEDDDVLAGGVNLTERLNEAEKLGIPKEEFMRIEKERAERRRKERERAARELHEAREKMRELEQAQYQAAEEARVAKHDLELAKLEAEEKVEAANRRIEETRSQVQKELDALNEKKRRLEEESVRRTRNTETDIDRQKNVAEELLRQKEHELNEREREVAQRLEEAQEREEARIKAEEARRKRELAEIEMWKDKAIKKAKPSRSDGVQTDEVVEKKKTFVDSEIQMDHSPTGESGTQTRHDIVVIDDPTELNEIFEIKRQTGPDVSLVEAIRQTSPERNRYSSSGVGVGGEDGDEQYHDSSPSRRVGFNRTAESSTQGGDHPETRTRDVQTPDFQSIILKNRLKLAEVEYQEQVARSTLQLQALENAPRFVNPMMMASMFSSSPSLQRPQQQQQQSKNAPISSSSSPQQFRNQQQHLTSPNQQLLPSPNSNLNERSRGSSFNSSTNDRAPSRNSDAAENMKALNSTFTFAQGKNNLPEPSPDPHQPHNNNKNQNQQQQQQQVRPGNNNNQQQQRPTQQQQQPSMSIPPESTSVEEYQDRVKILYKKYAPEKQPSAIDIILNRYAGEERTLLLSLNLKYGPEPQGAEAKALLQKVRQDEQRLAQLQQQKQDQMRAASLQQRNNNLLSSMSPSALSQQRQNTNDYNNNNTNNHAPSIASSSVSPSPISRNNFNYDNNSNLRNQMNNNRNQLLASSPMTTTNDQNNNNNNNNNIDSDLYLDPVDFQDFFQQWELAPALLPQTANTVNATPRLAACKLTPEDIFMFPSLEAATARRAVRKQLLTMNQIEQQTNGRTLYNENAINALQEVAARVFYFSQVMYWAPPRNPTWKYVAVTGREILIGDDENHLTHRICLIGSPSETVSLSVILYQAPGAIDGSDGPCVLVIRTGTPPTSRVWTNDVDPSSNQQQQQQDILLFFDSGLQQRKPSSGTSSAAASGTRLPVQGRFAALRAQRLMCAIEFAIQSEGPVAANASRGSLVTSPVSNWILKEAPNRKQLSKPPGVDETSYLLERAAADLCGVRYSTLSSSSLGMAAQPPAQSINDNNINNSNFLRSHPSYMDRMPLAQAHYNKRMNQQNQNLGVDGYPNSNQSSRHESPAHHHSHQQQRHYDPQQHQNSSSSYENFHDQLSEEQRRRLALVDQRAAMHAAERQAREQQQQNQSQASSFMTPQNQNQNQNIGVVGGPPSKQPSRWGEAAPTPSKTSTSQKPIDPHTRNVLGLLNSAARKGATPEGTRKPRWIQDSLK